MSQAALAFFQEGQYARAEHACRQLIAADAGNIDAALILALSLQAQGRPREAIPLLVQLTRIEPDVYEHWSNLGNALRDLRRFEDATAAFARALAIVGPQSSLLFNIGLNQLEAGEPAEALRAFEHAAALDPDDPEIRTYYAIAALDSNDTRTARRLTENWREWRELEPATLAEAAWLLLRLGRIDEAEVALARAAAMAPDHPRVLVRQGAIDERTNRLDRAWAVVDTLTRRPELPPSVAEDLAILRAALAARGDDLDAARRLHEELIATGSMTFANFHLNFSLAKICDKLGDAAGAMRALETAHRLQAAPLRERMPDLFEGRSPFRITRFSLTREQYAQWPPAGADAPSTHASPIFVVGFPRSGTTMLETMLDAHPALASMDERPFLQRVIEHMQALGLAYPEDLGKLTPAQCDAMRAVYDERVARHVVRSADVRLVDKNPLNLLKLPLIRRLWPHAKIVLMLRHPADAVLSNYMQSFNSPAFVAMCETVESTARGYADAMDFWLDQSAVLAPDVLELRYEDLVADIEPHARRLIAFLELPWDDAVLRFHEHARKRGYISTPSYTQVIEPVNARAVGRALAYAPWLAGAESILAPYVERLGYRPLGT
ncbi:MAG TPA: sulfotransferase [Tahibacter sp.]|nr:sulfotransferase [Tahibacter sp.]